MAFTRKEQRANARRLKSIRNLPLFRKRLGAIDDYETVNAVNEIWDVLDSLQDRMLKPAKPRIIRRSRSPQMGKLTGSTGTMRIKEQGDGFGRNSIEIMGSHNWKQLSAKLPLVKDLNIVPEVYGDDGAGINTGADTDPEGFEEDEAAGVTKVNISWLNAQIDRVAQLERTVNVLLTRLSDKDLFDLKDMEKETDLNITVGKTIG